MSVPEVVDGDMYLIGPPPTHPMPRAVWDWADHTWVRLRRAAAQGWPDLTRTQEWRAIDELRVDLVRAVFHVYGTDVLKEPGEALGAIVADAVRVAKEGGWTPAREFISPQLRTTVYKRDKYACVDCGNDLITELVLDHEIPVVLGGATTVDNLRTLCKTCNAKKGVRL